MSKDKAAAGRRVKTIAIAILVVAATAGTYFAVQSKQPVAQTLDKETKHVAEQSAPEKVKEEAKEAKETVASAVVTSPPVMTGTTLNLEAALKERIMGDANAPVTIYEHSSLTCGHCANFHKTTFKELKKQFIDTGKARIIFTDFPLNKPALDASMVARCLPAERYFSFVELLFETQDNWAFGPGYLKTLKQNAQLAGLSPDQFDACVGNEELQKGILARMEAAQKKYEINSTPSFAIGDAIVKGGAPLKDFEKAIKKEAAKAK